MHDLSISELQAAMARGATSAAELARGYLARIESTDRAGPALNAVIETNPDAQEIAEALDRERAESGPRGPLHGIPVLLKDNIDTADRMQTTAGSLALEGTHAEKDAAIVRKLRKAGTLILGKTNLSEWANFRGARSTSGWSSRGGQTRNPYALDRNPCGSSSGSAVAAAAGLCAAAVGTETDGSIICPSSVNGIVGLKPTVGLVSRSGIIPIAHSQDTAGPMARSVADAAVLLGTIAGADPSDGTTLEADRRRPIDYTQYLDPDGLRGARIGVARGFFGAHPAVDRIMEAALDRLRRLGAELIDPVDLSPSEEMSAAEFTVLLYEFKHGLNRYLNGRGPDSPVRSIPELIDFNTRHADRVLPFFGQERLEQAQEKGPLDDPAYIEALEDCRRLARDEGIDRVMREHRLAAIVAPSGTPAWLTDPVRGDPPSGGNSSFAAVAGYPHITLPAGFVRGLPVGISFFSAAFREPTLLSLAYAFEQAEQLRVPPQFPPSLPLGSPGG